MSWGVLLKEITPDISFARIHVCLTELSQNAIIKPSS